MAAISFEGLYSGDIIPILVNSLGGVAGSRVWDNLQSNQTSEVFKISEVFLYDTIKFHVIEFKRIVVIY